MPSRRDSRQSPPADVPASEPRHFDGHAALTWPFPETPASPVWQAWRAARDVLRGELESKGWAAVGLSQVMASSSRGRTSGVQPLDPGEAVQVPPSSPVALNGEGGRGGGGASVGGHRADELGRHFDATLARKLQRASLETLGDVAAADASGRQWWALAPGIGPRRAREIALRVQSLLKAGA